MKHRRFDYLLISIISFLICLLVFVSTAKAEWYDDANHPNDFSWMAQAGIRTSFAGSMGYDPGIGVAGEAGVRYKFLETRLSGDWMAQHKKTATSGNHYNVGFELRGYVIGPWYLLGEYSRGGYWSHFEDEGSWAAKGTTWSKHGHHWAVGAGFNNMNTEVAFKYYLKEHETPNQTESVGIKWQQRVWKGLFTVIGFNYSTWWQGTERWDGLTSSIGIAWRF